MAYENSTYKRLDAIDVAINTQHPDPVNAPSHYLAGRSIEPIDVIEYYIDVSEINKI